jgi:hypothetical protein
MISTVLSLFTGGFVKYLVLGVVAIGLVSWTVNGITAPYRAKVAELTAAAQKKEAIILADAARAEADRSENVRLEATLESLIHETRMSSCKLDASELDRLRQLASGKR